MFTPRKDIEGAKVATAITIKYEIERGYVKPEINGLVPMIIVGRVSARRWYVGWNYQRHDTKDGDIAVVPHPEDFIETVKAYHWRKLV
jgi:hypothetical protein